MVPPSRPERPTGPAAPRRHRSAVPQPTGPLRCLRRCRVGPPPPPRCRPRSGPAPPGRPGLDRCAPPCGWTPPQMRKRADASVPPPDPQFCGRRSRGRQPHRTAAPPRPRPRTPARARRRRGGDPSVFAGTALSRWSSLPSTPPPPNPSNRRKPNPAPRLRPRYRAPRQGRRRDRRSPGSPTRLLPTGGGRRIAPDGVPTGATAAGRMPTGGLIRRCLTEVQSSCGSFATGDRHTQRLSHKTSSWVSVGAKRRTKRDIDDSGRITFRPCAFRSISIRAMWYMSLPIVRCVEG